MTFYEFVAASSFWDLFLLSILACLVLRLLVSIIFAPITSRLDALIKILKGGPHGH